MPLRELVRQRLRAEKSSLVAVVRIDGEPQTYRFQVVVPRMQHPGKSVSEGRLVIKVQLDERDLPERPALACFDILQPFDAPALVGCALNAVAPPRYEASVEGHLLPTSRGRWIVFLVDAARSPARGMSGGVLVEIPLGVEATPPRALSALEEGLWSKTESKVTEALEGMPVQLAVFEVWLERFVRTIRERAALGLEWCYLFDILARRAPWVLLAAAAGLPQRERYAWLDLYRTECRGFTLLGLSRSRQRPLRRHFARESIQEIIQLIETAKQVHWMPRIIELALYQEVLEARPEGPLLLQALDQETFGRQGRFVLPAGWSRLALPMLDLLEVAAEDSLRGRRAAALLQLRQGISVERIKDLPRGWEFEAHGALDVAFRLIDDEARAKPGRAEGHARAVVEAECLVARAASVLTAHREHGARLSEPAWNAVGALERLVPDLLNVWLLALGTRAGEGRR